MKDVNLSNRKNIIFITILFLLCLVPAIALGGAKGRSGGQILKFSPSPRASAMAGAFSAVIDDIHSMYYNPAGLCSLKNPEISAMMQVYFEDVTYTNISYAQKYKELGYFGGSIGILNVDDIEKRLGVSDAPEIIKAQDMVATLSYARPLITYIQLYWIAQ